MNILYICSEYPPFSPAGIGTVTQILAEGMVELGHTVHIAGVYGTINSDVHDLVSGVLVHRLRQPGGRLRDIKARVKLFTFVKKLARAETIDLIETPDYLGLTAFWFGKLPPILVRLHGSGTHLSNVNGLKPSIRLKLLEKSGLNKAVALVSVSKYAAKQALNIFNIHNKEIQIIYNSTRTPKCPVLMERDPENVIFTGTLMRLKGIFSLIEAWNKVAEQYRTAKLNVYGKDSLSEKGESVRAILERMLKPSIRHTVTFHGHIDRNSLINELSHAGIAVFPSFSESLAMAPLEAMATGCPTISSKLASGPEVIDDGIDGLLVNPSDPDEIAQAILRLLNDTNLASELGKRGFEKVKDKFNTEKIILQNEAVYKRFAGK
jgi:glycogen(starch) synthase